MRERILLTVAARGGSKGVKDKNIRSLCGIPLIAHSINQAKRWGKAQDIVCSTDSDAIAEVARQYGAQVPFMRPPELATDTCGKIDVLRHALLAMEEKTGTRYDVLVDLDATAPLRTVDDIERGFKVFLDKRPDTVVSVVPARRNPYFNMLEERQDGYVDVVKQLDRSIKRRQDAPVVYDMNASIYFYNAAYLRDPKTQTAIGAKTLPLVMAEHTAVDIDSEEDLRFIELLIKHRGIAL